MPLQYTKSPSNHNPAESPTKSGGNVLKDLTFILDSVSKLFWRKPWEKNKKNVFPLISRKFWWGQLKEGSMKKSKRRAWVRYWWAKSCLSTRCKKIPSKVIWIRASSISTSPVVGSSTEWISDSYLLLEWWGDVGWCLVRVLIFSNIEKHKWNR